MRRRNKLDLIRILVKEEKPHLLLQETKKKDMNVLEDLVYIWKTSKVLHSVCARRLEVFVPYGTPFSSNWKSSRSLLI